MVLFCKVEMTKTQCPPLTINLQNSDPNARFDFFGSFTNQRPNQRNNEQSKKGCFTQIKIWPDNDEKARTFGKSTEYYMKLICHFERSFLSITPSFGQAKKEKKKKVKQTYMPLEDLIKQKKAKEVKSMTRQAFMTQTRNDSFHQSQFS